jgi:hypothetical protein
MTQPGDHRRQTTPQRTWLLLVATMAVGLLAIATVSVIRNRPLVGDPVATQSTQSERPDKASSLPPAEQPDDKGDRATERQATASVRGTISLPDDQVDAQGVQVYLLPLETPVNAIDANRVSEIAVGAVHVDLQILMERGRMKRFDEAIEQATGRVADLRAAGASTDKAQATLERLQHEKQMMPKTIARLGRLRTNRVRFRQQAQDIVHDRPRFVSTELLYEMLEFAEASTFEGDEVEAMAPNPVWTATASNASLANRMTDADGRFAFEDIVPGQYFLFAGARSEDHFIEWFVPVTAGSNQPIMLSSENVRIDVRSTRVAGPQPSTGSETVNGPMF